MIDIAAIADALQRDPLFDVVSAAFVVGSEATGERSEASGTSDVDVLLVASETMSVAGEFALKAAFRTAMADEQPYGHARHWGVRCRQRSELTSFTRYLAIQGFHASSAIPLRWSGSPPAEMPEFSKQAASRQELACAYGEALWSDLRSQGHASPVVRAYHECKSLLMYVNLLLVANGKFEATHARRIETWAESFAKQSERAACLARFALDTKRGKLKLPKDKLGEIGALRSRLRRDVLAALRDAKDDVSNPDYSCQFWHDIDASSNNESAVDVAQSICELLLAIIELRTHSDPRVLDDAIASKFSVLARLALIVKDASLFSSPELAKMVHSIRVTNSRAAFRDWGDTSLLLGSCIVRQGQCPP